MSRQHIIVELPDSIIIHITTFLSHNDLLSFRISCASFYHISFCKAILKRFHVQIRYRPDKYINFLSKLNEGRHVRMSLHTLDLAGLNKVLPHVVHVSDVTINVLHLNLVIKHCKQIKRLVLNDDKVNYFGSFEKEDEYEIYFKPLFELQNLQELIIKGCNQAYSSTALSVILKNVPKLTSFCLDSITVSNGKKPSKLSIAMLKANHIKHWYFINVVFIHRGGLVLPKDVLSFHCINTVISPLNENHSKLKQLVIDGMIPYFAKFWKINNFSELEYLELRKGFFYRSDLSVSSKLVEIKLYDCHLSQSFLLKLSNVVQNSLKLLTIRANNDYDNRGVLLILDKFPKLEFLELIDMNQITSLFLYEIHHDNLIELTIRNCRQFFSQQKREEVAFMSRNLPFAIKLLECLPNILYS